MENAERLEKLREFAQSAKFAALSDAERAKIEKVLRDAYSYRLEELFG